MTTSLAPQRSPAADQGWPPSAPHAPARHIVVLSGRALLRDLLGLAFHESGSKVTALHPTPAVLADVVWGPDTVAIIDGHGTADPSAYLDLVQRARERGTEFAALVDDIDELSVAPWVELGVAAVVPTTMALRDVRAAVERLLRGEQLIGVAVREGLLSHLRKRRHEHHIRTAAFASLSRREAAVLRQLAEGLSPEDIARTSFVSLNTVRTQVRAVLTKLGVRSIVAAVALAYRSGWMGRTA